MTTTAERHDLSTIKPLFDETGIAGKVSELAHRLNSDYENMTGIVVVVILKGSFIFAADLVRKIHFDFKIIFLEISSYGDTTQSGNLQYITPITEDFTGKHVIIVEDIVDTGNTLNSLSSILKNKGAKSIEYVTLLIKPEKCKTSEPVKYAGFEIHDAFVVGYGMDYRGKFRNLPYIADLHDATRD